MIRQSECDVVETMSVSSSLFLDHFGSYNCLSKSHLLMSVISELTIILFCTARARAACDMALLLPFFK